MAKAAALVEWRERRMHRSADGAEYYNYPDRLAYRYFYYVLSMGQARLSTGYRFIPTPRAGFLLHYTHKGSVSYTIGRGGRKRFEAPQGTACLMDYSESNETINPGSVPADVWWILFDGRDVPHLFTELRADRDPIFGPFDVKRFESLFLELLNVTQSRPAGYDAKAFAALAGLIAELFAARTENQRLVELIGRKAVLSDPVRKGIDYMIRFHGDTGLGVKRLSDAASLSLRHFMRLFREEVGLTPIQYLNRYRVERAKQLLLHSDKTIEVGSSRVDLQACKLEYSIVSPK